MARWMVERETIALRRHGELILFNARFANPAYFARGGEEALNYRCLKYVRQTLGPFQVLVGPNATGKTTFLDVIGFLGDVVSKGLESAVASRTNTPSDLTWWRKEKSFE